MKYLTPLLLIGGLGFLFFSVNVTFTGAIIGTSLQVSNMFLFILSLIALLGALLSYASDRALESLVIPTGGSPNIEEKRLETAMKQYGREEPKPYILVTGRIDRNKYGRPSRSSQYRLYSELRKKYGLKPSDMIIEGQSKDTLENFLYSIKKLQKKGINKIKIATNPTQFWRFRMFEKRAKKEGLIDKSFEMEPLYTEESGREFIYGILAYIKDSSRLAVAGSLEKADNYKEGTFGENLKKSLEGSGKSKIHQTRP